ncbi:MAG TPA: hypothetical protein VF507_01745 [Pyrinomonadaceae bacterium]|jgi:hypothetical protein
MSVQKGKTQIAKILETHLTACGDRVVLRVPDSTLEEVGEALMIAAHGEPDRKTVGRVCFEQAVGFLLGPIQVQLPS